MPEPAGGGRPPSSTQTHRSIALPRRGRLEMPSGSPLEEPRDPRIRLTTGRDSGCARMISARDKAGGASVFA